MEAQVLTPYEMVQENFDFLQKNDLKKIVNTLKRVFESYLEDFINKTIQKSKFKPKELVEKPLKNDPEYFTIKETCKLLGISNTTLWRWSERGRINKYYLFGNPRYLKSEVLDLFKLIEIEN